MEAMRGKRLLFVGVKDARKNFVWDILATLGVQCYVIGTATKESIQNKVAKYIFYDCTNHEQDEKHCDVIVDRVTSEFGDVDGCLTLWDDCVPLTALICVRLGKSGIPYSGARAAKQKSLTFEALEAAAKEDWAALRQYISRCCNVSSLKDVEESSKIVGFPAVMKTEYGGGAMGARFVGNVEEARAHYQAIQTLHHEAQPDRKYLLGAGFSSDCVIMEFLEGSEHCVDLALLHGELVVAMVTDKGPKHLPDTFHTVVIMPSLLSPERQTQVIKTAWDCCRALGLLHGLFNVDVMLTSSGPKLLEINARMGGLCQRDLILHCYGPDLLHLTCMLSCDIRPSFPDDFCSPANDVTWESSSDATPSGRTSACNSNSATESPGSSQMTATLAGENPNMQLNCFVPRSSSFIVGLAVYPWKHAAVLKTTAKPETLQELHDKGELLFFRHETVLREQRHELPFCTLAAKACSFSAARKTLETQCTNVGIAAPELAPEHYSSGEIGET